MSYKLNSVDLIKKVAGKFVFSQIQSYGREIAVIAPELSSGPDADYPCYCVFAGHIIGHYGLLIVVCVFCSA